MQLPQLPPLPFRDPWVLRALQGLLVLLALLVLLEVLALEGNRDRRAIRVR
jgi:hypothetical protein